MTEHKIVTKNLVLGRQLKTQNFFIALCSRLSLITQNSKLAPCSRLRALCSLPHAPCCHNSVLDGLKMTTQNSKLKTQNIFLCFLLLFCLFATPCFAQNILANPLWRLPSLPNLPSGERFYDAGGASPDQPYEFDSVSRPIDAQGELKSDKDNVKVNKYKIGYNGSTKRTEGRIEERKGARQADLEATEFPDQPLRQPDTRSLGFQYQPPLLGRMGFGAIVRKPNEQTQE